MRSKEEKIAEKIADSLDSATLNLDEVGYNLARGMNLTYNRLLLVVEAMESEKEAIIVRESNTPLF
jgi:hypothetical protein